MVPDVYMCDLYTGHNITHMSHSNTYQRLAGNSSSYMEGKFYIDNNIKKSGTT